MLFFCSILKVSVATRLPFTRIAKLPESTRFVSPDTVAFLCVSAACETALATATAAKKKLMRTDLAYLPVFYMDSGMAVSKKFAFKNFDAIYASRDWAYNVQAR